MLIVQWERTYEDRDGHERIKASKWHSLNMGKREDADTRCGIEIPRQDADVFYSDGDPTCETCYRLSIG